MDPTPATQAPATLAGPHLFNLSNVQQFYGGAGADMTVAGYWKLLPATVFLQVTQRGAALLTQTIHLSARGELSYTPAYYLGPYRIMGTDRVFPTTRALGEYLLAQRAALVPEPGAATVLGIDGSVQPLRPASGRKTFTFAQLRPLVGAETLEIHNFDHGPLSGYILVIDEESKFNGSRLNLLATAVWFDTYPPEHYSPIDVVMGTVVLMRSELLR